VAEARRAALWSPEALDDRERIWDYYVRVAGRHTAEKILREIAEVIALIEDHPFAGRARNEVRPGLRSFPTAPHIVFYRVANDTPEVVRVLDGRQDIEEKFAARNEES
jgi:toxin ParE1/3/4